MDEKQELLKAIKDEALNDPEGLLSCKLHHPDMMTKEKEDTRALQELEHVRRNALLKIKEKEEIMKMRKAWSRWILGCIVAIVFVDFFIIFALGFGKMHFKGSWTVPVFVADGLIKIIGLAMIVVKFLFNKDSLSK